MATMLEKRAAWFAQEHWASDPAVWERWVVDSLLLAVSAANDRQGKPDVRITQALVIAYGRVLLARLDGDGPIAKTEAVSRMTAQLLAVAGLYEHMKGVVDAAAQMPAAGGG